jgi:thiol-disulfide isomerase/thioredoxin
MVNKRTLLYAGVGLASVAVGLGYGIWEAQQAKSPRRESVPGGEAASTEGAAQNLWNLSFERPDGKTLALASLRGKPLLVNFWATWCPPCIEELPLLDAFYQQNKAKNWQTLGLAVDQTESVQKFLTQKPLSFPVAMAGMAGIELTRQLGNVTGALPFSVLFNAQGALVQRKLGKLSEADLKAWAGA